MEKLLILKVPGNTYTQEKDGYVGEVYNKPNKVVIMAGGLGTRMGELTRDVPKPMLDLGGKPVLERIVQAFVSYGFCDISISVNYKQELIRDHFGDGEAWGAQITYLEETERLGTAGSLSLLTDTPEHPIIVMNGDLLTSLNFESLLQFHAERKSPATLCVKECTYRLPFGVVNTFDSQVVSMEEKPLHNFYINAGIYVLDPSLLSFVPKNQYFDITTLFAGLIRDNVSVNSYVINEFWMDIGRYEDYEEACALFA